MISHNGKPELIEAGSEGPLGRVGSPQGLEANSDVFHFWIDDGQLVEKTQLIRAGSEIGTRSINFYGMVTQVFRRSRRQTMLEEADRYDGLPGEEIEITSRGVTYAEIQILATDPNVLTPPREEARVYPAIEEHVKIAYGFDQMSKPVIIGMVRNGGEEVAGPARIDLDYVLGSKGGHLNVTGIAGVGTKSSFLTIVMHQILREVKRLAAENPGDPEKIQIKPIILNVKGHDLFWLDRYSKDFSEKDLEMWRKMGWDDPRPMECTFYAAQQVGTTEATPVGRSDVKPYSWTLADIISQDLFGYLFNDSERDDDNFAFLISDVERVLVEESPAGAGTVRRLRRDAPQTFREFFDWFQAGLTDEPDFAGSLSWESLIARGQHHTGTLRRFFRRLRRVVQDSAGIFQLDHGPSFPLDLTAMPPGKTVVIDLENLRERHLQRFVVAVLLKQAKDDRTGPHSIRGLHYVFMLDELNRFAPRGHSDPITQLVEEVAAELRSRGVILLGAQQQASLVSARVVENAAVRVLGRTGGHELTQSLFSFLPEKLRDYVERLGSADKVVYEPSFREPMNVRVPRAPWAMRKDEADIHPPDCLADAEPVVSGPRRLPPVDISEFLT